MLSSGRAAPPHLDEFFAKDVAPLRTADFAALGWTEAGIWGEDLPPDGPPSHPACKAL